jgi:hemoglobin
MTADVQTGAEVRETPFDMIGGVSAVSALVERFYDLMDADPRYRELRAMHAEDLGPMRTSLTGFLTAWLGGPRDWFENNPGKCVMSAHAPFDIGPEAAGQWIHAMGRAMADTGVDPKLAALMSDAFERMAGAMRKR